MNKQLLKFKENYQRLYNICFKNNQLASSPKQIENDFIKNGLSSGEVILCRFALFLWNRDNNFQINQIDYLDKNGRKFILESLNEIYL